MTDDRFRLVGVRPQSPAAPVRRAPWYRGKPIFSAAVLTLIVLGCLFCEVLLTHDPTFLFGTDPMGRDIFSMIWYGGRISLTIGVLSTLLSTAIAILFGTVSGCAPDWLDRLLMRLTEILLSVPNLLLVVLLQAILGTANVLTLSLVIGLTSWASIAKVVRTEVRRLRSSEYVLASRCMGGGFFHVLRQHLAPNFFSSISFMVVMNIRSAITAESTLSFLGIGLPIEVVSWGSMLSLSEKALLTDAWWIIVIPGVFLVATLLCITELANAMRRSTRERTL